MLDLGFFRSASFSVGTAAVSVAFFALLGGIFALTQYLQFVHGYSAIEAGAIMSPIALGLMMGAGSSSKAAERLGVARVVAVGLAGLAIMLAADHALGAATRARSRSPSGSSASLWRWAGSWRPPPTRSSARCRAAKSGVASATNTVARMVSGALGVAVIGSLVSSLYSNDMDGSLGGCRPRRRPRPRTRSARPARSPPSLPPTPASELLATTGDAFTQAMGTGLLVAAALAAAAAVVVLRFLPAQESGAVHEEDTQSSMPTFADADRESVGLQPQS